MTMLILFVISKFDFNFNWPCLATRNNFFKAAAFL